MTSQQTIDLHAHTLASDGSDTPLELVGAAAAAGIEVLAVTDHDTVEGLGQALAAGERAGVQVLPGCEVPGDVDGRVVHLLAYGEGLLAPGAIDRVAAVRRDRQQRNLRVGAELEALTGVGYADALELAGGAALSRAHFARALVRRGAVADVAEAFDGLEVWHSQHDDQARRRFMATAERHGLLATGGSDYHGRHKPGVRLGSGTGGNVLVPAYAADDLKERLAAAVRR